jgi:cholesterol oxidase
VAHERFDAIVVGTGFGGSVTAAKLVENGWDVLVLERGRPHPPGSFPRSPAEMAQALWDPGAGRFGMFDVWFFQDLDALVASGLGGGSLIYANVLQRTPPESFAADERWPLAPEALDEHYAAVEDVLDPVAYPYAASTPKTAAFTAAATGGDGTLVPTPLAISFGADPDNPVPGEPLDAPNLHGVPRSTCRLCGACDVGCDYGAKNTLDLTYLSAIAGAADIRTLCEVRTIARRAGGGYEVGWVRRDGAGGESAHRAGAPHVVLCAGTLGTTRLLLRNRASLPGLSTRLGDRFSTNGDLLTFARATAAPVDMSHGPVITTTVRWQDGEGLRQMQDGGVPSLGPWLVHLLGAPGTLRANWRFLAGGLLGHRSFLLRRVWHALRGDRDTNVSAELARLFEGASPRVLPMLGMGRDRPVARLRLDGDDLELAGFDEDRSPVFRELVDDARAIAARLGGRFYDPPLSHLITVHPLGGCAMAASPTDGVVDTWGRVFGEPGLHVADGSVLPGPTGPNPSLTIAALADRFATALAANGPP